MPKQIVWSPQAEADLNSILEYLHLEWNMNVAIKFIKITEALVLRIGENPKQFPVIHKNLKIRKCVITKHNSLYYREWKVNIGILRIYDNRQDPKKLKFTLPVQPMKK